MGKHAQKSSQNNHRTIGLLLIVIAIWLLTSTYAYFDALSYQKKGFSTYTGICREYRLVNSGKTGKTFKLTLDERQFITTWDNHLRKDFFDEVRQGDTLTVAYIPQFPLAVFRRSDSVAAIEKDGKAYLDTEACMNSMRVNGWIGVGLTLAAASAGIWQMRRKSRVE